jgi:sugar transferase (PEP-CTERM system associated)
MLSIGGQKVPSSTLFLLLTDAASIMLGELIAIFLRFPTLHSTRGFLSGQGVGLRIAVVAAVSVVSLYYNDLYALSVSSRKDELFLRLLQSLGMACLVLAVVYYLIPAWGLGRGIAILAAPAIFVLTFAGRLLLEASGLLFHAPQRVLVVGTGPAGVSLVREILSRPELNLKVVGFLDEKGENLGKSLVNPRVIGAVEDVEKIVERENVDQLILSLAERRGMTPVASLLQMKFNGIAVDDAHAFDEKITGRILLEHLSPSWLIFSEGFRKSAFALAIKRTMDVVVSAIVLVICSPVMALVAAAIWLESGRPILFRQERVGLRGRPFNILKFRSMYQNAEANGPSWAAQDDHRVTKVGRFIRDFRLDELPQLFNALRGEMSLVGPRPERPFFCELLEKNVPLFVLRNSVRPGITGWAQVKYQYGSSIEEAKTKLEYDFFYLKHLSLFLDVAIILETAKVVLSGRGAK